MNDLNAAIYNNSGFPEVPLALHAGLRVGYSHALTTKGMINTV